MATYSNIKKIKIGDNIFNLYDSGGTITSVKTTAGAHTAINVTSGAANFNVPTKTSHLTNDSGFITVDNKVTSTAGGTSTTFYIVGSSNNATETGTLLKVSDIKSIHTPTNATITLGGNGIRGEIQLFSLTNNTTYYTASITPVNDYTANRTFSLPNKSGTFALTSDLSGYVPTSRTINSKALTGNISLTYSDVGALPTRPTSIEFQPSSANVGNGGFIDFHYNQSTADYTSRIIETSSGLLNINNVVSVEKDIYFSIETGNINTIQDEETFNIYYNYEISAFSISDGNRIRTEETSRGGFLPTILPVNQGASRSRAINISKSDTKTYTFKTGNTIDDEGYQIIYSSWTSRFTWTPSSGAFSNKTYTVNTNNPNGNGTFSIEVSCTSTSAYYVINIRETRTSASGSRILWPGATFTFNAEISLPRIDFDGRIYSKENIYGNGRIYTNANSDYATWFGRGYTSGEWTANRGIYDVAETSWLIRMSETGYAVIPKAGSQTSTSSANLYITSAGVMYRHTSSSQRYKTDIKDIANAEALYNLPVHDFKYKEGYLSEEDSRYDNFLPGFIAEEVEQVYPIAVEYKEYEDLDENATEEDIVKMEYEIGQTEDWNVRFMIPPMLKLIQDQKKKIDELEERLQKIENN